MTIDNVTPNEMPVEASNTLAARREARRRKILENAESRLRKLTGVEQKSHVLIDDFRPVEYEEISGDNQIDNNRLTNNFQPNSSVYPSNQRSFSQISPSENAVGDQGVQKHKLSTLIGISLLANLLTVLSSTFWDETESNVGCNMIFLPFIGFKFLEYYLQRNVVPSNNIVQLFLMANLRNDLLNRIFSYTQYLTNFTQDLCVYFFVFVFFNQLSRIILMR